MPEPAAQPNPSIDLSAATDLLGTEQGLCVISLTRPNGTVSSSLVNVGPLEHPGGGGVVLGLVAKASAYKCRRLRVAPRATVTITRGWRWQAVEGAVTLIGPFDPHPAVAPEQLPALLRMVFAAAGGTHDDWDHFDRVMADEQRTAVLLVPDRVYGIAGR